MTTREALREILTELIASSNVDAAVERVLDAFWQIDDHAGEPGTWSVSTDHGSDGPYDTREEALADLPTVDFVADDDNEED